MQIILFIILLSGVLSTDIMDLTTSNLVMVKNQINKESVSYAIEKIQNSKNTSDLILYLDSPGGNVEDGLDLITEIRKNNISCVAQRAYSMAFAILQSCEYRYMLPSGRLMQHQISFGIEDSLYKIQNYVSYVSQMENYLVNMQANKINMNKKLFVEKTANDWWIFGENAIFNNIVDGIVDVKCSKSLIDKNFTQTINGKKVTYSNCPIIHKEREKEKSANPFSFLNLDSIDYYGSRSKLLNRIIIK